VLKLKIPGFIMVPLLLLLFGLSGVVRRFGLKRRRTMSQLLLMPDPRPLDQQLGQEFFREAPKRPGVYLMRDAADRVLYVGKAKNLQQRLRNYRIANPDRMPRRHLRMVRTVARIELQFCRNESAALKRESKLLRALKPRFNRAGVWQGKTRFFVWRRVEERLELAVTDVPETGWQRHGPMGGDARRLHRALACLLWLAMNPGRAFVELPAGWAHGRVAEAAVIYCGNAAKEVAGVLAAFFWEASDGLEAWLQSEFAARTHPFERTVIAGELEILNEFSTRQKRTGKNRLQLALL
jgi:predicted GIY-YIG superfamily endonuclease